MNGQSVLSKTKLAFYLVLAWIQLAPTQARAHPAQLAAEAAPQGSRIAQEIADSNFVRLNGNINPMARPEYDQGAVGTSFEMHFVTLHVKPSAEQQAALKQLLAEQQDPSSANYRKWVTPEEYAERFGLQNSDLSKITAWLKSEGFKVKYVARARNWVAFDGSAGQVEGVFQTQIHRYRVDGEDHYSNAIEPSVPASLAGVIANISGLDDFHPTPQYTFGSIFHFLAPDDIATIYSITPLFNLGYTGAGQTLVVAGQSNINVQVGPPGTPTNLQDIRDFRKLFSLPAIDPVMTLVDGVTDPGIPDADDLMEAELDVEWAGAVARNATIVYVYSNKAMTSAKYAIDQDLGPVLSYSYGDCESVAQSDLATLEAIAQQANAEGITWIASSGDSGAAACDLATASIAEKGLAVNIPASIPEVTGVGGTRFTEGLSYWNYTNGPNGGSAVTYIPEEAWNDTLADGHLAASGGGDSSYYLEPPWQTGLVVPDSGFRHVPDVAFAASADHDGYIFCTQGTCSSGNLNGCLLLGSCVKGGTSAATPVFAGMVTLLNQWEVSQSRLAQAGLGNINATLYRLALAPITGVFNDIQNGDNKVPCDPSNSQTCPNGGPIGYDAGPGYDRVTGLGSVNASPFVTNWDANGPTQTTTSITVSPPNPFYGQSLTLTATVTSLGSPVTNGTVSFGMTEEPILDWPGVELGSATLNAQGQASVSESMELGSGNYTFTANFAGGIGYSASSGIARVTVSNAQNPAVNTSAAGPVNATSAVLNGSVYPDGLATTAWFEYGTNSSLANPYTTAVQSIGASSPWQSIAATAPNLTPGSTYYFRIRASNSFGTAYGVILSFTVNASAAAPTTTSVSAIPANPSYGQIVTVTATVTSNGVAATSGTINFWDSGTEIGSGTLNASGQASTQVSTLSVGQHTITAIYLGNSSYALSSGITNLTVGPGSDSVAGVAIMPSTLSSGGSATMMVTLSGPAPSGGAVVSLASSNRSVLSVPSSLIISGGNTTGAAVAQAGNVASTASAVITATYNNSSSAATGTVVPSNSSVVLSAVTISPSTIIGDASAVGIVTLTGPAPASGAVVNLNSNNPHFVQVPASQTVTVLPGYTNADFPITTSFTNSTVGATIQASYNGTMYYASVTVLPVAVTAVTFSPTSVPSGYPVSVTVWLSGPAPAGGASVSLVSSDPSALQVSSPFIVPAGAINASTTATTSSVVSQESVGVTASYNSSSVTENVTVTPLVLTSLGLSPIGVTGGNPISGTVYLSAAAPPGRANVTVSSSSGLVQVPSPVSVPAGAYSAPFTATTSPVNAITNVTVTASYGGVSYGVTVTLTPPLPNLASLTLSPTTVVGGTSSTATVMLTAPAPLGGTVFNIGSSFWAIAQWPGSSAVDIPQGSISGNFAITTAPVNFIYTVTLTATYNGVTLSAVLTVVPPGTPLAPSSLALSPPTVTGGASSTGTVSLTAPAPPSGAIIALSSDNPVVQVPSTAAVPQGQSFGIFTVDTTFVSVTSTATITATYNGTSQSSLLTVKPSVPPPPGNPVPFLASPLVPVSQLPGGSGFSLTAEGSGFVPGAQILWNGTALPTNYVSPEQLQANVPAASIQSNRSPIVAVQNPGAVSLTSNVLPEHLTYARSAPSFNTSSLTASGAPAVIATGDFNGDGKFDLVIGKSDGSGLSIYLGNGDGTFGPERRVSSINSSAVAVDDFNGDGKPDIVFNKSFNGGVIGVLLGNGDGTFTALPDVPLPSSPGVNAALAVGDFNGDGALDLVVTGTGLTQAYVLLGNGDGTFGTPVSVGSVGQPYGVAVGDFNRDGNLDIALSDASNQAVAILFGNGNGTFQAEQEYPINNYTGELCVADFNGDGYSDIAVGTTNIGNNGAGVVILLNKGDGTFSPPSRVGMGIPYYYVAADDINGDGKLDLVVSKNYPPYANEVFLGNGDGTFASTPVELGTSLTAPATIADINGDGAPDVLIPNYQGSVTVLLQSIAPILQVAPGNLSFTVTQGGGSPAPAALTISNTGGSTETWSATTSQTWLSLSQSSGSAPSTVNVTANPSGLNPGAYNATITVTAAGASNSPQTIPVTLTVNPVPVVAASLRFNPTSLIGPGAATGTVTLSGPAPVGGATVSLSSDNSAVQVPATMSVAAGLVSRTFTASVSAVTTQTIGNVTASYKGVSTAAALTVNPAPSVSVSPTSVAFGNKLINAASIVKNVFVTNTGATNLSKPSITITGTNAGDFSEKNYCTATSYAPGAKCTISLTFTPSVLAAESATLTVTDNAANSPQTVPLTGTGVMPVVLSPTSLAFGNLAEGETSASKTITLTNYQQVALTDISVSTGSADYPQTNTCGTSIAAGKKCTITVKFEPSIVGTDDATLSIADSASNSPQTAALTGTGEVPVTLLLATLAFGDVDEGVISASKTVTVTNNQNVTLTGIKVSTTSTDYSQTNTCGTSIAAGKTCKITVTFKPSIIGMDDATLSIADSASNSPQTAALTGTGTAPAALTPASTVYGSRTVGTTSLAKVFTLSSYLETTLTGIILSTTGDFAVSSTTCGTSLAAKGKCTINVTFKPTATGTRTGTLSVSDSAANSPQISQLTGTGK